jgi:two-component system sensor kinase FixL
MAKPGSVRVSISDNGPGIDPLVADSLFNPFTTTKKTGMGVGLSISKTIIEVHGGEIGFYANVPRGAVFYFTLPVESR